MPSPGRSSFNVGFPANVDYQADHSIALYFNASKEEIELAGASPSKAVRVKSGGYIASLGVYHELHCLNRLRYSLYSHKLVDASNSSDIDHLGKPTPYPTHLTQLRDVT